MMQRLFGLRPLHSRTLREIVEVVAILLAGIWALYVFVYENRIKPTLAPPTPSISVEMRHVGKDGELAVIRIDESIRNPGPAEVHFLAYSLTVIGSKVVGLASPRPPTAQPFENELQAYYAYSQKEPVFRDAFVTYLGDPRSGRGLFVEPGQTTTLSSEFYVPSHRFEHLTAWVVAVYSKSATKIPTTLRIKPSGLPQFEKAVAAPTYQINAPIAELDLKAE